MQRTAAAGLIASLLALLAAAGSGDAAVVDVHIQNSVFVPSNITIDPGDTLNFINDDSLAHDVTFEAGFGSGAAGSLAASANWSHVFATNGTFKFRCQVHSANFDSGMVGRVQVGAAAAPPPAPSGGFLPGFELLGAIAAVGFAGFAVSRRRNS